MSARKEKVRKRSEEVETESKKAGNFDMDKSLEKALSSSTSTTHPEANNQHIIAEEAKSIMANLQITNIDSTIALSIAKHMSTWQKEISNIFAICAKT